MRLKSTLAALAVLASLNVHAAPAEDIFVTDPAIDKACLRHLEPFSNAWVTGAPRSVTVTLAGVAGELNCHVHVLVGSFDAEKQDETDYYVRLRAADLDALIIDKVVDGEVEELKGPYAKTAATSPPGLSPSLRLKLEVEGGSYALNPPGAASRSAPKVILSNTGTAEAGKVPLGASGASSRQQAAW